MKKLNRTSSAFLILFFIFSFATVVQAQLNPIAIGQSGNVFGVSFYPHTQLWADPNLNSVAFIHRGDQAGPPNTTGNLYYDLSTNGGNTWTTNVSRIYSSMGNIQRGRYPQTVIYNPSGNTNPSNAYISYFCPTTDGVGWSGVGYGSGPLGDPDTLHYTQTNLLNTTSGLNHYIPGGFTITQQNVAWNVDAMYVNFEYTDTLLISKGTWNNATHEFDYTVQKIYAPVDLTDGGNHAYLNCNIAFSPDGQTGYATLIGHQDFGFQPDSSFYPIVYKTADGGNTWSLSTNIDINNIGSFFGNTGGHYSVFSQYDNVVDANGNLHIITTIQELAGAWSVSTAPGTWGLFDVYTPDAGVTWRAQFLTAPMTFSGTFGDGSVGNPTVMEYNRCQCAVNWDGTKIFFSWIDTDTLTYGTSDNIFSDLYVTGYDLTTDSWTTVRNESQGTVADGYCTFAVMSNYVFDDGAGNYSVPVVITQMIDPISTSYPVTHFYTDGIDFSNSDFSVPGSSVQLRILYNGVDPIPVPSNKLSLSVSPNPVTDKGYIHLTLPGKSDARIIVSDVCGRKVLESTSKGLSRGENKIYFNSNKLTQGIYFVNVIADGKSASCKVIVQ